MSTDFESDSELKALRNELLTGLQKKRNSFDNLSAYVHKSLNPIEENDCQNTKEDQELEMLRLEALNAKRSKDAENCNSSSGLKVKNNILPGRFRYDKDSDEEENEDEDEDEFYNGRIAGNDNADSPPCLNDLNNDNLNENSFKTEQENSSNNEKFLENDNSEQKNLENIQTKKRFNNNKSYQYNYQTYRTECSKLMSNEEYDPNTVYELTQDNSLPHDFDLRNFLRQKALIQQEHLVQQTSEDFVKNGFYTDYANPDDIVYSEPITKPIEITTNFMYNRYRNKNYNRFNNNANNGVGQNFKKRYINEENAEDVSNNDKNGFTDSESDEDNSFLNNKKLKSVIVKAVISSDPKSENLNSKYAERVRSRSRDNSRNRYHKRK